MSEPLPLAEFMHSRLFALGEYLCREGDAGDELFIIVEGQVAIIKEAGVPSPLVLNFRGPGEMIGEIALLTGAKRTASVLAVKDTTVGVIEREAFWREFDETPAFREAVLDSLIRRLLAADESRVQTAAAERELFSRLSSMASENERLAEVMQLRQETMRFIVHDLRNPLNLIMMALSVLKEDEERFQGTDAGHFLTMALGGVQRMFSLVESLLDVERLDGGEVQLDLERLDLDALVERVVAEHRPLAQAAGVDLVVEQGASGQVLGDRGRLERVVSNLLDNALKYSDDDGTVAVSLARDGAELTVAVEDGGPGIPPEQRQRVFDRFVQLDGGQRGSRGFGLGLAYCRSAVNAHGGRIWVEEGREGGARFVFTLPLAGAGGR